MYTNIFIKNIVLLKKIHLIEFYILFKYNFFSCNTRFSISSLYKDKRLHIYQTLFCYYCENSFLLLSHLIAA